MLSDAKAAAVEAALAKGMSIRAAARTTGVSRAVVTKIQRGTWRREQPKAEPLHTGPIERCRCGRRMHQPCLACAVEALRQAGAIVRRDEDEAGGPMRIELAGRARHRYERLLAEKQLAPDECDERTYEVP